MLELRKLPKTGQDKLIYPGSRCYLGSTLVLSLILKKVGTVNGVSAEACLRLELSLVENYEPWLFA